MASQPAETASTILSNNSKTSTCHAIKLDTTNPGNPVFSCDKEFTKYASTLVTEPKNREPYSYCQHPMYITTSNSYGLLQPSVETCPTTFHGKSQKFSEHLAQAGMHRNSSLNTSIDKSIV